MTDNLKMKVIEMTPERIERFSKASSEIIDTLHGFDPFEACAVLQNIIDHLKRMTGIRATFMEEWPPSSDKEQA